MAEIHDIIKTPEAGWRRQEQASKIIGILGNWFSASATSYSGGSNWYVTNSNLTPELYKMSILQFRFIGTKLRIYGASGNSGVVYTDKLSIIVDGEEFIASEQYENIAANTGSILIFQKENMERKAHTVTIRVKNPEDIEHRWAFDCIDVDEDAEFLPTKGNTATSTVNNTTGAVAGCKRYHSLCDEFIYEGAGWTTNTSTTTMCATKIDDAVTFNFYGSEIYLYGYAYTNRCDNAEIWIDDVLYDNVCIYDPAASTGYLRCFSDWRDPNGVKKIHKVKIVNKFIVSSRPNLIFFAVDTDGYLTDPTQKYIDITPVQFKNDLVWAVTASSVYTNYNNYYIINGTSFTGHSSWCSGSGKITNQWIQYDCKTPTTINAISLAFNSSGAFEKKPLDFRLEGCDDGTSWKVIQSWNDYNWEPYKDEHLTGSDRARFIPLKRTVQYRYYRFCVDKIATGNTYICISSLRFCVTPIADRYLIKNADGSYSGYDKVANTLTPATLDDLNKNILEASCLPCIDDLPAVSQLTTDPLMFINAKQRKINVEGEIDNSGIIYFVNDYYFPGAKKITKITLNANIDANAECKIVVSKDNGLSWYTYNNDNGQWSMINDVIIPMKDTLSQSEKEQRNSAITKILADGMSIDTFNVANWTEFGVEKINVAIAVKKNTDDAVCEIQSIDILYDKSNKLVKLDTNTLEQSIVGNNILVKPIRNIDKLFVNISTRGV